MASMKLQRPDGNSIQQKTLCRGWLVEKTKSLFCFLLLIRGSSVAEEATRPGSKLLFCDVTLTSLLVWERCELIRTPRNVKWSPLGLSTGKEVTALSWLLWSSRMKQVVKAASKLFFSLKNCCNTKSIWQGSWRYWKESFNCKVTLRGSKDLQLPSTWMRLSFPDIEHNSSAQVSHSKIWPER